MAPGQPLPTSRKTPMKSWKIRTHLFLLIGTLLSSLLLIGLLSAPSA